MVQFQYPLKFRMPLPCAGYSILRLEAPSLTVWLGCAVKQGEEEKALLRDLINELMN